MAYRAVHRLRGVEERPNRTKGADGDQLEAQHSHTQWQCLEETSVSSIDPVVMMKITPSY
jgi:hypothetical protein